MFCMILKPKKKKKAKRPAYQAYGNVGSWAHGWLRKLLRWAILIFWSVRIAQHDGPLSPLKIV